MTLKTTVRGLYPKSLTTNRSKTHQNARQTQSRWIPFKYNNLRRQLQPRPTAKSTRKKCTTSWTSCKIS